MLSACPEATYVMVPIAFPGKEHGWWTKDTVVAHPPGFWLASSDPDAEEWISYRKARDLAEEAAEHFLGEMYGQPGYAIISREGPTPVFEGYGVEADAMTETWYWPCGCLINKGGAHRVGCPNYPEGIRADTVR
jgi:hypothetical protein